jgi:ABC-type sugar transport system permease subunit
MVIFYAALKAIRPICRGRTHRRQRLAIRRSIQLPLLWPAIPLTIIFRSTTLQLFNEPWLMRLATRSAQAYHPTSMPIRWRRRTSNMVCSRSVVVLGVVIAAPPTSSP